MLENKAILLSIIIPTKNRQYTCMYALESALLIESDIIEVVVQDCSDTNELKELIFKKFGDDKRVKYFYTDTFPSMTDNWNLAISNTTGKYICFIGDDDAVLPGCLEISTWMDKNNVQAMLGALVTYIWKDAYKGTFSEGKISHSLNYTGDIFEIDTEKEFAKKALNCGFGYAEDLPNIYHGIVEKNLLILHKNNCGYYLASTCPDVYSAMILPAYLKKSYYLDYPLTVRGTSGSSNSNRSFTKKDLNIHFNEYKNFRIPEMLPQTFNTEVAVGESLMIALHDTKKDHLISDMNLAVVYAKSSASDLKNFMKFFNQYKNRKNSNNTLNSYFRLFFKFLKHRSYNTLKNFLLKGIFTLIPTSGKYLEKYANRKKMPAPEIISANNLLIQHLSENSIKINYNGKIKKLDIAKTFWE